MNRVVRWNPWNRTSLLQEFDRMVDDLLSTWPEQQTTRSWGMAVDVTENEDAYVVKASVPGINPDDIEITLTDNVLTIRGESQKEEDIDEESYHLRERRFGQFARSITLPTQIDADGVDATCENGVLTVHVPKAEEVKPRRISVKDASDKKVIEADTR